MGLRGVGNVTSVMSPLMLGHFGGLTLLRRDLVGQENEKHMVECTDTPVMC